MSKGDNDRESGPTGGRHFMSLGGGFPLPPKKLGLGQTFGAPNTSKSFVAKREQAPINNLPDIFTTCPELRKFSMVFNLTPKEEEKKSKPPIEQVQQVATVPVQQPPPQPVGYPYQPMAPRFFVPMLQFFDPNAPIIRPHELGFVPKSEWPPQVLTLWDLRQMYFTRRNGVGRRFDFKLYNALCITKMFPTAYSYIGAIWIGSNVMKIHSQTFAQLLGIHAVQGGLFHKQGNFSRHGFHQVMRQSPTAISLGIDLRDVDDYSVRLFTDQYNRFSRDTEFVITDTIPPIGEEIEEDAGDQNAETK